MQEFWRLKKAFVKDVIEQLPDNPKPPYNTISSVVRILARKGYLKYKAYGKTYEYYPSLSKSEYRKNKLRRFLSGYFSDSPASLLSHIVKEEELSKEEVQKLRDIINDLD